MPVPPEMAFATIAELGRGLRAGQWTAQELAEFFLDRLTQLGPKLNAVVTLTADLARQQAQKADTELAAGKDRGPLHGIPYGAKDLLATRGIPTSWGAAPLKDQVFQEDASAIVRLQQAGAVLVAKLAMVEIAGGLGYQQPDASFTGPGKNPWNLSTWSGGSSSGSGSAVAAGLVPFALGTETWGSILTPAGYCGLSGLRPTYGRVSRGGAMALSWSLDKIGPLAHTVQDCGEVLQAVAGRDEADDATVDRLYQYPPVNPPQKPFRVAVLAGSTDGVQPAVQDNFEAAVELLKQKEIIRPEVPEVQLPEGLPYTTVASTLIDCELAAAFEGLVASGDIWEMTALEDRTGIQAALFIPARDYINAQRIRAHIAKAIDRTLAPFDAVLAPSLAAVACPLTSTFGEHFGRWRCQPLVELGAAGNASGIPALTVPTGFGEGGLPTGIQFLGRVFEENSLLAIAAAYQQETDWHRRQPPRFLQDALPNAQPATKPDSMPNSMPNSMSEEPGKTG